MEKEAREVKSKKKLMKNITRAASALSFKNPHFSPGREARPRPSDAFRNRTHAQTAAQSRGFSGPLISLVPIEARGKKNGRGKEGERGRRDEGFDSDEPRSPKVSCIGQIKEKKKLHKLKREKSKKLEEAKRFETKPIDQGSKKIQNLSLARFFRRKTKSGKSGNAPAPGLSQMKRFSSGRDAFANFDWTKQVAPVDRECYSDDDERRRDWDDDDEDEGGRSDVMIPFSAPMMIGGDVMQLQPRKEICLWKKRNMAPPQPLKLNTFK